VVHNVYDDQSIQVVNLILSQAQYFHFEESRSSNALEMIHSKMGGRGMRVQSLVVNVNDCYLLIAVMMMMVMV
jgi:hypothetical protein